MPTPRPLALVLALALAAPALGQSRDVVISADPEVPIAGLPLAGIVTFGDVQPTAVTFAVRRVGEVAYQDVPATDQGGGRWRAQLPFNAPPEGFESFLRYTTGGQTFTEPLDDPAGNPSRIPTFIPAIVSDIALPARQYRMVTVPLLLGDVPGIPVTLGGAGPLDIWGDDFGTTGDPAQWRVLRWNQGAGRAIDGIAEAAAFPQSRPGLGYWLITSGGGAFDVESGVSAGTAPLDGGTVRVPVDVPLNAGWTQIGNPFLFPIAWSAVQQRGDLEPPVAFDGRFVAGQTVLRPWEGYFVFNPGGPTTLRFPAAPVAVAGEARTIEAQLAAAGARVARVTATAGGRSDAVVVGLGAGRSLRKPPAVEAGLRLAVREGGTDRIADVRASAEWALALASDTDATLRVETVGDWPGGFVVDDLDRGVTLPVDDGRVVVPALGLAERRLRLRAVDVAPETALGRPFPNPSAGAVAVPFRLASAGPVRADVVDVLGRVVRVLLVDDLDAGPHQLSWDGRDGAGRRVAAGAYLLRLDAAGGRSVVRVTRPR